MHIKGRYVLDRIRFRRYKRRMPLNPNEIANFEATLATLDRLIESGQRNKDELLMCVGILSRELRKHKAAQSDVPVLSVPPQPMTPKIDGMSGSRATSGIYAGMSIVEAAVHYLKQTRKPQRTRDIVAAIVSGGVDVAAEHPGSALRAALQRRSLSYDDVVRVGHGVWALKDDLSPKARMAIEHRRLTSEGMKRAKRRGVKIGQSMMLSEQQAIEFKRLVEDCERPSRIRAVFGMSSGSYRNYKRRLENWKPGDPYPPKIEPAKDESQSDGQRPALRVVT